MLGKIKKLLTLEDLAKFCKEQNFSNFSSKDTGYQLSVQVPTNFEVDNTEYQDNTLLFGKIKTFHIGPNRNGSSVTRSAAEKALSTIAYKPLLANFCEVDGIKDFTSHDMEFNDDGSVTYIEHQIGCFTADPPVIQYDETTEKEFVFAKVAIPREYTDACDIIERKNGTKVSVELIVNEMNYSAKDDILELTDIIVQGCTCLGTNPETGDSVEEGMQGARLDIIDFSKENNSVTAEVDVDINNKLFEILEKLNTAISNFNNKTDPTKEGVNEKMDKLNELLGAYELTLEDIDFSTDGLSDEELEAAFTEAFGDAEEFKKKRCEKEESEDEDFAGCGKKKRCDSEEESEDDEEFAGCGKRKKCSEEESEEEEEDFDGCGKKKKCEEEPVEEEPEEEFAGCGKKKRCSVNAEADAIEFELSHDDIRMALYSLIEPEDDSWSWICEVYDNYFIYQHEFYNDNEWVHAYYKQSYSKSEDAVELSGDPVEVFPAFVTESERTALDMIRSQYDELKKFHDEAVAAQQKVQKDEIFANEAYDAIRGSEEFKALMSEADKYSVEELQNKCDLVFAASMKAQFAAKGQKPHSISFNFAKKEEKKKAYGNLFDK